MWAASHVGAIGRRRYLPPSRPTEVDCEQRSRLVWAFLVLARNWVAAVQPGFLAECDEYYRQADRKTEEWRAFVEAWWERCGDIPIKA